VSLIGEAWIDKETASPFAKSMLQEARDIWAQPDEDWYPYSNSSGLVIQSRHVTEGPFNTSGVLLTRGEAILSGASAKQIYEFLISPEGSTVIDPTSEPKEFSEHAVLVRFKFRKGHLEVAQTFSSFSLTMFSFAS
jgi:hypothetical protein